MDENSVSFQLFLILLLFITLGSESQISVFSEKNKLHKSLRWVQFLSSFISFYFEILCYLSCGEKIIRLASKNSVKLDEK